MKHQNSGKIFLLV